MCGRSSASKQERFSLVLCVKSCTPSPSMKKTVSRVVIVDELVYPTVLLLPGALVQTVQICQVTC